MTDTPFKVGDKVVVDPQREYFSPYVRDTILTVTKITPIADAYSAEELADMSSTDGWIVECDKMDSEHGVFNHYELISA